MLSSVQQSSRLGRRMAFELEQENPSNPAGVCLTKTNAEDFDSCRFDAVGNQFPGTAARSTSYTSLDLMSPGDLTFQTFYSRLREEKRMKSREGGERETWICCSWND